MSLISQGSLDIEKGANTQTLSAEIFENYGKFWVVEDYALIVEGNHISCENCFSNIIYLAYLSPMISTIIRGIWGYFEIFICGNFYC